MFLKEFMEEVAAIEAAGVFSDPTNQEVAEAEGEEVVGHITDPYLMALHTAFKNRVEAFKGKISQITEDEAARVSEELSALREITWTELRLHFGVFGGTVGLRKGWTVVRVRDEQPMPPELRILELLGIPLGALAGAPDDCSDPDCPVHGRNRSRNRRRKPMGRRS